MADRPNILFVFTDQQSLRAMGAYGNAYMRTPHMDALAAEGVRFVNSYCAAPVCGPSRASIVTGRMPHQVGVDFNDLPLREGVPTLGEVFREAGYAAAWAGKWHLSDGFMSAPDTAGFESLALPQPSRLGDVSDAPITDAAIAYLQREHDQWFLLAVSYVNPHDICHWIINDWPDPAPERALPPLPASFEVASDEPAFIRECRQRTHYGGEAQRTRDWNEARWRAYLKAYACYVERVDHEVGRLMRALRERGLDDDTLVIFTSDHGEGMAAHRWVVKLMFWEEVAGVPLIARWPGHVPAGEQRRQLACGVDLLPMMCDYAGIEPPEGVVGRSLRSAIEDAAAPSQPFVVSELQPDTDDAAKIGRMLRTPRFKYIVFSRGDRREMLFDIEADPNEMRDLATDAAHAATLTQHRDLLCDWMARTGDHFPVEVIAESRA
ncbi:MAG: sulfatase [Phycisphaeraceae bacterium]